MSSPGRAGLLAPGWAGLPAILRASLPAILVALLVGCAASPRMSSPDAPRPPAAAEAPEPEPTTVEEATSQLERGASRLEQALAPKGDATVGAGPGAGAGTPPSQPQLPSVPAPAQGQPVGGGEARPQQAQEERWREPCTEACRALASMRRAAETICRLAGPEDARCQGARRRVQEGEGRASPCGC